MMEENNKSTEEENYSPYCDICESCGEEGCCSPIHCEGHGGKYCKSNLSILKINYLAVKKFFKKFGEFKIDGDEISDLFWDVYSQLEDDFHKKEEV